MDDADPSPLDIRTRITDLAIAAIGLGAQRRRTIDGGDSAPGDGYTQLVAAGETDVMARAMCGMSGCALVVRGLWRLAGFDDARLVAPYKVGTAVELLVAMAREADAFVHLEGGAEPEPGDVFLLTSPHEHVATFMEACDDTAGRTWRSVDGGQRDAGGGELVTKVSRVRNGSMLGGRTLGGVIDIEKIAARFLLRSSVEAAAPTDRRS